MIVTVPWVVIIMMLMLLMVVVAMVMLMLIIMAIMMQELVWYDYINIPFRNVKLLQHFIDPYTGQTLPTSKTNICQKQFRLLDIEVERAKDHGLIEVDVPQVEYDYELYKKQGWGEHKWPTRRSWSHSKQAWPFSENFGQNMSYDTNGSLDRALELAKKRWLFILIWVEQALKIQIQGDAVLEHWQRDRKRE